MSEINLEELLHNESLKAEASKKKKQSENLNPIARQIIEDQQMVFHGDSFFRYLNGRYVVVSEIQMKQIIFSTIKDSYRQSKSNEIQDSMIAQCLVDQMNIRNAVNCLNGTYDFESKSLLPHNPKDLFTTQIQAIYEPAAKCDRWRGFLSEILGDDTSKIDVFQEYAGYALNPNVNVEVILFLLGRGANGKSVSCDVLKNVIGAGNYDTISLDDLKNKNYIAELYGKLINISTESQTKAEVYESNLKRLASGEEIKVDRKFKHPFTFKSNCKHIYCLNNMPRISDRTDAFFRRVIPIPFNFKVQSDKRILQLGLLIAQEEASGILNWMIEGYERLSAQKWHFTQSKQISDLLAEYRRDNNNVISFVEEECTLTPGMFLSNREAYARYQKWCKESGVQPIKRKSFISEITENFKEVERDKSNGERGLRNIELNFDPAEPF